MTGSAPIVYVDGRPIGPGHPPYIIAEMSGNHNGSLDRALAIVDAAKQAGADAVKMQSYTPDTITIDHDGPDFRIDAGPWAGRTLHQLYEWAHTPWDWHEAIFARARSLGMTVFSSPFDFTAVDLLESLQVPAYKIASFEIVDIPLIQRVASTGKPVVLSTGAASEVEIDEAVAAARGAGAGGIILLHCTSGYPTPAEESNLATMGYLAARHAVSIGLSDHTLGIAVPVAAVARGAAVIEKHLTLSRGDGGPDGAFSLEPAEFASMAEACRIAYAAIGQSRTGLERSEVSTYPYRRSLYVVADIELGEMLTERNIRSIRPGRGLPPKFLPQVLGARARRHLPRGTPLSAGDFEPVAVSRPDHGKS